MSQIIFLPLFLQVSGFSASGGTITTAAISGITYTIHTFDVAGSFSLVCNGSISNAQIELIGGGGGGGGGDNGGGAGGAGGAGR